MPEVELLRALAPEIDPPSPAARARAHAALLEHVAGRGKAAPHRRGWLVPVAGVAAAAAAAAFVFLGVGENGGDSASAATVLREAAAVARAQPPAPRPGPGRIIYTRSENAYLTTTVPGGPETAFAVLVPRVREIWLGPSGGLLRERSGRPIFLRDRDRERWIAAGRPKLREAGSSARIGPAPPLDLPTDPDAVFERLERAGRGHSEGTYPEMFTLLGDALRETGASPAQRAALYEVAARIPGVLLIGRVQDRAGREGIAVGMEMRVDGFRHTLIFDPDTSALLAEEQVSLGGSPEGYPEGTVTGYAIYIEGGVVEKLGERP